MAKINANAYVTDMFSEVDAAPVAVETRELAFV